MVKAMSTNNASQEPGPQSRKHVILLGWLTVAAVYFLLVSGFIGVSMNDRAFTDYMGYVVNLALREHRPAKEIRSLLLVKADELSIPLQGEQIQVDAQGRSLRVVVDYETEIRMPLFNKTVYRKRFSHDVSFTN